MKAGIEDKTSCVYLVVIRTIFFSKMWKRDLTVADPALCVEEILRLSLGAVTSYYRDVTIDIDLMGQTVV